MKIMKYVLAIVIGWIAGAAISIAVDPVAIFADNAGLLLLWPGGIVMGHHSVVLTLLLVVSIAQLPAVLFCGNRIPSLLKPLSVLILLAGASFVGSANLITLGSQI